MSGILRRVCGLYKLRVGLQLFEHDLRLHLFPFRSQVTVVLKPVVLESILSGNNEGHLVSTPGSRQNLVIFLEPEYQRVLIPFEGYRILAEEWFPRLQESKQHHVCS